MISFMGRFHQSSTQSESSPFRNGAFTGGSPCSVESAIAMGATRVKRERILITGFMAYYDRRIFAEIFWTFTIGHVLEITEETKDTRQEMVPPLNQADRDLEGLDQSMNDSIDFPIWTTFSLAFF
jgi:hypothetical protein